MSSSSSLSPDAQVLVLHMDVAAAKGFVVDRQGSIVAEARQELQNYTPMPGWAEQDPVEIADAARTVLRKAYEQRTGTVVAVGLTNQRESVAVWSPRDHQALYPIIGWQDNRTYEQCRDVAHTEAHRRLVRERSGLSIAPAFSAPKMHWLTNHVGTLGSYMGTLDSWLLYNLIDNRPHLTDRTNAARTGLFNSNTLAWDQDLLKLWGLHEELLPDVRPSFGNYGMLAAAIVGTEVPIMTVMGDRQASLYAAGNNSGVATVTYDEALCVMKALGPQFQTVEGFLTTLAVGPDDERFYALEDPIGPAASRVLPVRNQPGKLNNVLQKLSVEVAASLQQILTPQDKHIVIDGVISQLPQLPEIQAGLLDGVVITRQKHPEGTALGVAKLTFDRLLQPLLS